MRRFMLLLLTLSMTLSLCACGNKEPAGGHTSEDAAFLEGESKPGEAESASSEAPAETPAHHCRLQQ